MYAVEVDSEVEVLVEVVFAVVSVEVSILVLLLLSSLSLSVVVVVDVEVVDIVVVDTLGCSIPANVLSAVSGDELTISLAAISTTTRSARNNRQLSTLHELFLSPALSMLILPRSMSLAFSVFVGETLEYM